MGDSARDCRAARGLAVALQLKRRRRFPSHADDFGNDLIEALSLDELHRVKVNAIVLADVEHRYDIRVVQAGCHASLALKSFEEYRVAGQVKRQDLQGHVSAQRLLNGLINDPHAAAADFAEDAVLS